MRKTAMSQLGFIIMGVVVILVMISIFSPMLMKKLFPAGRLSYSGSETECKEADYKFPVYDDGQYIFCSNCEEECLYYEDKEACEAPKQDKCDSECEWVVAGLKGECIEIETSAAESDDEIS